MSQANEWAADDLLRWSSQRQDEARRIIDALDLLGRWSRYGQPVIVGAAAYGLVGKPDIDMEIFCERPRIEDGFAVVSDLALQPGIWKVRYSNELDAQDYGLYWQIRYRHPASPTREAWKVDMWLLAHDSPGPLSRDLIEPMRRALTDETRAAILAIKRETLAEADVHGIDVYRAVLDDGVRTVAEFRAWIATQRKAGLTHWRPNV
jgi:hypothetical protein